MLRDWAAAMPLPLFSFLGSFIEEIIAPIPSPFVMTLAGSFAEAKGQPVIYLALLAAIGAIGKTIGALIIYWIADKFENLITGRFGKFLGVSHSQITNLGSRLEKGPGEWWVLFSLRAIPIMPTAPVSFAAGILQLKLKSYLTSTLAGLFVRNLFYLYLGYSSTGAIENLNNNLGSAESFGYALILIFAVALIVYIYRNRRHNL